MSDPDLVNNTGQGGSVRGGSGGSRHGGKNRLVLIHNQIKIPFDLSARDVIKTQDGAGEDGKSQKIKHYATYTVGQMLHGSNHDEVKKFLEQDAKYITNASISNIGNRTHDALFIKIGDKLTDTDASGLAVHGAYNKRVPSGTDHHRRIHLYGTKNIAQNELTKTDLSKMRDLTKKHIGQKVNAHRLIEKRQITENVFADAKKRRIVIDDDDDASNKAYSVRNDSAIFDSLADRDSSSTITKIAGRIVQDYPEAMAPVRRPSQPPPKHVKAALKHPDDGKDKPPPPAEKSPIEIWKSLKPEVKIQAHSKRIRHLVQSAIRARNSGHDRLFQEIPCEIIDAYHNLAREKLDNKILKSKTGAARVEDFLIGFRLGTNIGDRKRVIKPNEHVTGELKINYCTMEENNNQT